MQTSWAVCMKGNVKKILIAQPHLQCIKHSPTMLLFPSVMRAQLFTKCMIKIFRGARVVTRSKPPPPYEQLLPLPTPCFKMFLERSLNDPHPHHPTSSIFHCYPSPSTTPPLPLKKFDHTLTVSVSNVA